MKKNDIILIGTISIIAMIFYIFVFSKEADIVKISIDGIEYGTYSLDKDQIININNSNTLQIIDNTATMIEADCPDQLCIHQASISKNRQNIICLPNKVIAEVISVDETEFDVLVY